MMGSGGLGMAHAAPRMFARSETAAKEPLPLAPDYFDKIWLTGAAAREYEVIALALVNGAVDRSRKERIYGGANDSWRDIGATNGFKRFTKTEDATQFYRVQGVLNAPMTNVMSMLYAERNASIVARRNVFYGNGLDGQNLKTLRERTIADRHQHMALRWEAFNISTSTVNYKFDSSFLEYTGITLDQDRAPVGFKVMHSVELPECKPLLKSHGLRRLNGTEIITLRASANTNYTELTMEGSFEVADKLPSTVLSTYLTQITQQLSRVPMAIQAHRLGAMKLVDKSQWVPSANRKNCSVCLSRFGLMGKKHHCRTCGEIVCKSCFVTRPHHDEDKFCKKCVVVACAEDELHIPERTDPLTTPSNSSTTSSARNREFPRDINVVRDSYAMGSVGRYSDPERLSGSVFNPHTLLTPQATRSEKSQPAMSHKYHHEKLIGLDDLRQVREDNHSMTASETSYGSTYNSLVDAFAPSYEGTDSGYYREEPEESVIYLDTKTMQRATSSLPQQESALMYGARGSFGATGAPTPTMQDVESSLAQQRHLLKEMMIQASQASQANQASRHRQYPVSSNHF